MKLLYIFALLAAVPASAGPNDSKESGTETRIISHLDLDRHYLLHLPKGKKPTSPIPLIIALHGATTNGVITEGLTELSKLSDSTGEFAVAYPSGEPTGGIGIWDFFTPVIEDGTEGRMTNGRDDIGFLNAMIDQLIDERIADRRRIYVTGISNGAFMTNRISFDLGDKIAAIAPVAGTIPKIAAAVAKPKRAMPVIYFHGTDDKLVGIDGSDFITKGKNSLSALEYCNWWAEKNGIQVSSPRAIKLPNSYLKDGCTVEKLEWKSLSAPVIFYRIVKGGHTWPGGSKAQPSQFLGTVCRDIDASRLMWEFFKKHPLP